jgi:membrane-associated phospholipid phosphatase
MRAESGSRVAHGKALGLVGGLLLPLGVFAALAAAVAGREAYGWDRDILRLSYRHYDPAVAGPLEGLLNVSIALGAAFAFGTVAVSLVRRRWALALFWTLAVGGVLGFDPLLKGIFDRPPIGDVGGGFSFPSGNAMASVVVVGAIALTSSRPWRRRTLAVGIPIVVAYGGVLVYQLWHYPSDVVAGWCIAVAWITALWVALGGAVKEAATVRPPHAGPAPAGRVQHGKLRPHPGRAPAP